MTHRVLKQVNERDLVGLLQDQHAEMKRHHIGWGLGPAGIVQVLRHRAVEDELAELLDGYGCLGLEDRIRMIAKPSALGHNCTTPIQRRHSAVGFAHRVYDRTGT